MINVRVRFVYGSLNENENGTYYCRNREVGGQVGSTFPTVALQRIFAGEDTATVDQSLLRNGAIDIPRDAGLEPSNRQARVRPFLNLALCKLD